MSRIILLFNKYVESEMNVCVSKESNWLYNFKGYNEKITLTCVYWKAISGLAK